MDKFITPEEQKAIRAKQKAEDNRQVLRDYRIKASPPPAPPPVPTVKFRERQLGEPCEVVWLDDWKRKQ